MRTRTGAAAGALMLMGAAAQAGMDKVILQVTGEITGSAVELDRQTLDALPQVTLETSTVVTDGTHSFTGFLVRDLLERLDAKGELVIATALNDYVVEIPMADFYDFEVIVAYGMDGEPLPRNDKGPLWIVYPRDDYEVLQDIRYDYRWVWQLSHLEVQ
ncbi:molybdopterin-dependent oxidoreductase (plasmid) [Qingshengfaniella alkalisoli]|uniref:Molybdopterin-dependent oxidoreductase n=2 Tax=Qingshengfaniella alkalisoli TaxID=2599296 RepID=A0A5B8IC84_9RHOB|nr:molybdopterin-dependent oxidoreductase [Qingshengfaniella alkalisoli]